MFTVNIYTVCTFKSDALTMYTCSSSKSSYAVINLNYINYLSFNIFVI